jgi:hypothetical protein
MPRKLRLTALQRNILWTLEEAGEETLATVVATLLPDNLEVFHRDVQSLIRLGLVCWSGPSDRPKLVLTAEGRRRLTT